MKIVNNNRVNLVFIILLSLYLILLIRALYLNSLISEKSSKHISKVDNDYRYDVFDRNGQILATDIVTYTLYAEPYNIRSVKKIVADLKSYAPDLNWKNIARKLTNKNFKGRVLLIRDLTPKQKLNINNLGNVGLYFHEDYKRFYPYSNIMSHLLGFVDYDEHGLSGFEGYVNKVLKKKQHIKQSKINLAIDIRVQNIVHEELTRAMKKFSAKGAVGIVMDVKTAEIFALVSLPDYNPYDPGPSLIDRRYNNKASYDTHEMGSTFKIFTMALALEKKLIKLDDMVDVSKNIKISGYQIKDFKKIKEEISYRDIFVRSSNIGTSKIAQKFSDAEQQDFLKSLNLFEPLEVELIEKSYGNLPKKWGLTRKITASYGYGISVTAIHLIQAVNAIVNNGTFLPATILKGKNDNKVGEKVISTQNSSLIRELMREVVRRGTARKAFSKGYDIGGKTGSANKVGKYGYDEDRLLSSFIGVFPVEKPKFIIYSFLDEPQGIKETGGYATGGATVAPLVKNIIERIAPIYDIAPEKNARF